MILIDKKLCDVCGTCVGVCPVEAMVIRRYELTHDTEKCIDCLACVAICPVKALSANSKYE